MSGQSEISKLFAEIKAGAERVWASGVKPARLAYRRILSQNHSLSVCSACAAGAYFLSQIPQEDWVRDSISDQMERLQFHACGKVLTGLVHGFDGRDLGRWTTNRGYILALRLGRALARKWLTEES